MSWECAFPGLWSAQSKESSTTGTRKNRVPSATIIHPSYQQRGHQGHMSCSLRIFFDVVGNVTFPGLWSAQSYGSSTTGTRETRHHRQRSSIHHISNEGTRRTSCSLRFFFDVVGMCVPWFVVCSELWIFYHRHQGNQAPSTTIIHPSYHNEGTRANELLTTVLL